ncbi:hypothetical protein A9404_10255 [Halothiobacillus diazotrophicus]|uniref:Uncharacterized protein n=2 Tax=Halothiobacillus diazotrophicus TaxID=1860122 RepID=A0A191ZIL6_9GAMM|nr:hypothetical protein A9404_10255 [Halothiobacillus diazotrophicus]
MLTFATQALYTGSDPWPLKFINVLIHMVNGVLIYILSSQVICFVFKQRSTKRDWLISPELLAVLVTAAWLFSPMQLTAVLYVIQRMESLSALFVLGGLLCYWEGRMRLIGGKGFAWPLIWTGLVAGTLLATFSKETGVMLPLYAFLLEWVVLRGRGVGGFEPKLIFLFIVTLVLPGAAGLLLTVPSALNGNAYAGRPFDLAQRLWTEGRVLVDYLHWLIAPTPNALSLYHDDILVSTGWFSPWTTAASWVLIALLLGLAVRLRKRAQLFALGVLWFFCGQALVSTYLPLELVYEHRNYLPSWGIYIALLGLASAWQPAVAERSKVLRTLVLSGIISMISLFALFTAIRSQIWGNPYRLAYFEATTHPESPRANYDLARNMLIMSPDAKSAIFHMGMTQMAKTSRLPGASLQAEQAMIFMAAKNNLKVESMWWIDMRRKINFQPMSAEDVSALYALINCSNNNVCKYTKQDRMQLGNTLLFAMERYPKDAAVVTLYANYAANVVHNIPLAYSLMQRALAIMPSNFNYWNNLVTMQVALGEFKNAQVGIERMRELNGKGIYDSAIRIAEESLVNKKSAS